MTRSQRYFPRGVSKTQVIPQFEELECPNLAIREFHLKHSLHLIGLFVFKHVRFVHFFPQKTKNPSPFQLVKPKNIPQAFDLRTYRLQWVTWADQTCEVV